MSALDLAAIERHIAAVEDDDLANIPEDIADNATQVCEDARALIAGVRRLRGQR